MEYVEYYYIIDWLIQYWHWPLLSVYGYFGNLKGKTDFSASTPSQITERYRGIYWLFNDLWSFVYILFSSLLKGSSHLNWIGCRYAPCMESYHKCTCNISSNCDWHNATSALGECLCVSWVMLLRVQPFPVYMF